MSEYLFKDILLETKDGEWGKGEPSEDLVRMKVIRGTDFETVRNFRLDDVPERFIPRHIAERKSLKPYDILLETAGGTKDQPTGRSVILKPELFKKTDLPITCASFSRFLRVNSDIANPEYIFWWLQYMYESRRIEVFHVQHTGVARFQYTLFATTTNINLPLNDEQSEIVRILSCLDKKMELKQRMNETLEGIAQALFKSWFVNFDPVKAKSEGRKPEGMDDPIATLFPSRFTDSQLGLIPEGWEVKGLDEIATFLNGLALQKYPALDPENYLPVIKISQLRAGDIAGADKASTDVPPDYIIRDGDILFSWSGSLEVEIWCGGRGALNQHLFKVSSKDFPKWFYFLWTRQHLDNFQKIAESKATTMGHIQRRHLSEAKVICPPVSVIQGVNEIMEPMLEKYVQNKLENRNLAYLLDLLLPRLISGKLRVGEISKTVEAMAL